MAFALDPRLQADSRAIAMLGLCELRAIDDRRWPWLVLVPQREEVTEIHALTPLDQVLLAHEQSMVAEALQRVTGCASINVAALGNVVAQLHVHVVARDEGDPNWPGPVWGHGTMERYATERLDAFVAQVAEAL